MFFQRKGDIFYFRGLLNLCNDLEIKTLKYQIFKLNLKVLYK